MVDEELIAAWRRDLESTHGWRLDRSKDMDQGILNGLWVHVDDHTTAPFGAYFKPTTRCKYPAAAREKIAADLAYDLDVPAVPVLLCDSGGRFGCEQAECCVALVTHERITPWGQLVDLLKASDALRAAASEPLSRIAVFDTWIGNPDRVNAGNLIFCEQSGKPEHDGFRALDHASAFGGVKHSWRNSGWADLQPAPFPEPMRPLLSEGSMLRAILSIEAYSEESIRGCVERIPDHYMDASTRNDTVNGLIGRKVGLKALVLQHFGKG
jgi:hypothetical protein